MKLSILIPLIFITFSSVAQSEKSITNSEIKEVKVFLSGAEIHRSFSTSVENGISTIAIENLSSLIDRNSISVSSSGDATILSLAYSLDYLKDKRTSPKLKTLNDTIQSLNDEMNELNMLKSVYNDEAAMLNANKETGGSNTGVNAENLQKVINFYRMRMIEVKTKILETDKKIVKLAEKIKKINEQIGEENGKNDQPFGTILVSVSAKQRLSLNFEISYFLTGASWVPSYDLRSADVNSPVSLVYKASVTQQTGESWKNVSVSLSTGNPALSGTSPVLQPWYLGFSTVTNSWKSARGASTEALEKSSMADVAFVPPVVVQNENQLATEFEIKVPYTVLSDGRPVMMEMQSHNLPALYNYSAAPRIDKDAFLLANITGWEKLSLLPGKANIYFENTYVGESMIDPSSTTDTLALSFGRDKRIIIKRERLKEFSSSKFFGNNIEKEFVYEITVKNTKKNNISVTLNDQIPLSTNEAIKISAGELSNGNFNKDNGFINWKLEIKPGESQKIRFGYKVKYPKDQIIPGI